MAAITQSERIRRDDLWLRFKQKPAPELRNELAELYLPILRGIARNMSHNLPSCIDGDDLHQAGFFGLLRAIDRFDLSRRIKFETYCVLPIRGAMLDWMREHDWVPRLVRLRARKVSDARKAVWSELGRPATDDDLGKHLDLGPNELAAYLKDSMPYGSVNMNGIKYSPEREREAENGDSITDPRQEDPVKPRQQSDLRSLVCKGLNRNERLLILLYYYEQMSMKEIGQTLDLSESRISQMHTDIVARIKERLEGRRLEFVA